MLTKLSCCGRRNMSSTGRSDVRRPSDFYETPDWCVKVIAPYVKSYLAQLIDFASDDWHGHKEMEKGGAFATILDPGAGSGNITKSLRDHIGEKIQVSDGHEFAQIPLVIEAIELEPHLHCVLQKNVGTMKDVYVSQGDFFDRKHAADCIVCNPPYSQAMEFIKHALKHSHSVWMLLRLDFLGSNTRTGRGDWYRAGNTPDVYVMSRRPSFTNDGKTDSNYYGWFHWHRKQTEGKIKVLEC